MRKYITLLLFFVLSVATFAVDYTPMDKNAANALYLEATLQAGTTGNINIYMKSSEEIGTITMQFFLPEGIDIADDVKGTATEGTISIYPGQPDGSVKLAISGLAFNNPTATKIASFPVTVNAAPGNYKINAYQYQMVTPAIDEYKYNNVSTDLIVQKSAVIEELGDGNFVSIVPVAMKPGFYADGNVTALDIYYTSKTDLAGLSFNLNLPHAEFYSSAFDEDGNPVEAVLNNDVYNNSAKTLSVETVDDQNLKITYSGVKTTRAANQRYIKAADVPTKLATIYIESEESLPADIYTLTLSDITLEEYVTAGTGTLHTGKNYSTIVVGTPEQTEGIIYGYCTSSAASEISSVLKNVAIIDVTSATVDENVKFSDVIVNTKDGSYYSRTSANYGTTCLPYSLTGEFYTVKEMTASSIILEEVSTTTPNEPYIFKGTIDATDANQVTTLGAAGQKSVSTTTFKGTYEATNIAAGAGYYIATDGKFYSDGATVRPFRAYFDGAVAGVKSFNVLIDSANGLIDITDQLSEDAIYSLQGIRMNNAQKGIIIKGGKKVYVK